MKLEEMKTIKRERGLSNEQIAEGTGLPPGTVRKIFSGETKRPRYATLQALERFFDQPGQGSRGDVRYDFPIDRDPAALRDLNLAEDYLVSDADYHRPDGEAYTIEDLERIRGDKGRGELIDGKIYNLASPPASHQLILGQLMMQMQNCVDKNGGDCLVLPSPVDVCIENTEDTVLQPDILVLCDWDLIGKNERVMGAPDLVVEILSPSTRNLDKTVKLVKYQRSGVREYWIVDPTIRRVIVYDFAHEGLISLYTFQDKIPICIWDGNPEIDFASIDQVLRLVFGK